VKTALVADPALLDVLIGGPPEDLAEVVVRCVRAKARIVEADEREGGPRAVLNAGHTVGHALETVVGPTLPHGEAVAIGLVAEARWAVRAGVCVDAGLPDRLAAVCRALGLPVTAPPTDPERLLATVRLDKKSTADKIRIPLPVRAGEMAFVDLPRAELGSLLDLGPPGRERGPVQPPR
jgi:3-dehydroquinate synthase